MKLEGTVSLIHRIYRPVQMKDDSMLQWELIRTQKVMVQCRRQKQTEIRGNGWVDDFSWRQSVN